MSSNTNNEFLRNFIVFFGLLLAPLTTQASSAMFVKVELSCGPTGDKKYKSFSDRLFGAIAGPSIALTRSWRGGEAGFSPMVGYLHKGKLIIKGEGRQENSNDTWKYYFSEESKGSIKETLLSGVEGKGGSRKCKLKYIQEVSSRFALVAKTRLENLQHEIENLRGSELVLENKELKKQVAEVATLKKQISELESQITSQANPSDNLVQMATLIASLKEQLSDKDNALTDLKNQVSVLEEKVSSNTTKSQQTINGLEAQITEKNNNIQSLTTALQTLQSTPATAQTCPEVAVAADAGDGNNPIIKYLEGKNAELTKQLENCGKGADKTAQDSKAQKPKPENAAKITDVVFENKWQLSDAVKCSSGSYTIYDKAHGNVFVLNGEKQITPNITSVRITELADNKIRIDTEILANDMFKQLNNGQSFAVLSTSEEITVVSDKEISTKTRMKQLDTSRFMANPTDKIYNTSEEGGRHRSCGPLPGAKNVVSSVPKKETKIDPLALPNGRYEAASYCQGVLTMFVEQDLFKGTQIEDVMYNHVMRLMMAAAELDPQGQGGESMTLMGMEKMNEIIGDTLEEHEIEDGKPAKVLSLKCAQFDPLS